MNAENLVAWLPFDESTTQDLCGNAWTASGSPTIQDGMLYLDGSSYLKMTEQFKFTGQPFTISCEFSGTSNTTGGSVCLWQMYIAAQNRFHLSITTDGLLNLWKDADGILGIKTSASVLDGRTHHAEVSFDGSTWYLFVDGALIGSKAHSPTNQTYTLYLGINVFSERKFTGTIDNFMIYDGVALHTENFTPPTNADYLQLRLDMGLPAPFEFDADTARQVVNATGQTTLLHFDGMIGCYGELPLGVLAGATTFTIEAKFSTTETTSQSNNYRWKTIIGREIQDFWQDDFGLCVNDGKLCFWSEPKTGGSSSTCNTTSDVVVNDGATHEVAVVSSEGAIDLYCDGELVAHTDNVNAKITDAYRIAIAGNVNNSYSYLQMDLYEARFWSRALTADELFATLDGTEQGLEAHYLPEVRTDNILPDISGNENHATLYGSVASTWSLTLDADTEVTVTKSFGYENIDAVTTSELIRVEDDTFNLTGSAFYSADLILPSMPEVWIEFSVYNRDLDGWQVGNDHDNFTGIAGETPESQDTSTPLGFAAYNLNSVISDDASGLTKGVQTFLMHMIAGDTNGLIEVWIDGVPHYTYRGNVNGGNAFDKMFLYSSGATCFQSFRISNTEFPSKQIIILDFDVEALVVNEAFAWSVDETHVERYWAPPGGSYPPNFIDVVVHDRTAWYQTVVTKAFDLPPTYHLWIDFDVYFDGVHSWRAGNIGEPGFCGITSGAPLSGFSNGVQVYPTTNLLQAAGDYEWTPVLVHLQSGTNDGIVEAWFNGDKVFEYTGNVNDGEPFADPVLQSDGAGTYFSYLLFSTNPLEPRRNVDTMDLCLLRNGQVLTYPLYAYETCDQLALAIYHDGRNWYNILRDPSDERASDFYITHAESTYALTKG